MTFKDALKQCRKVGTSNATGEALAAMYAKLVAQMHGGKDEIYFDHLRTFRGDMAITERSRELLRERSIAWDVLMGISPGGSA
jgi:hypothetical protein